MTRYTIGIDMGGTNTHVALVNERGNILWRSSIKTTEYPTAESFCHAVSEAVTAMCDNLAQYQPEEGAYRIEGIGVGAPCANSSSGAIEAATNLPWPSPIPLAALLNKMTGIRTVAANDANAAAIGEMMYGGARGCKNFIMITLGTGVGGGVVCDGHLLNGTRGFATELGHITFPFAHDRLCTCGRYGCLQTVASASGVVDTAQRLLEDPEVHSTLRDVPADRLTSAIIFSHAEKGDRVAREVFRYTGECLGMAAAEFAAFTDPEAIILFGGVANAGEMILGPMREALERQALHLYKGRIAIRTSSLPFSDAAILGAASLPYMTM